MTCPQCGSSQVAFSGKRLALYPLAPVAIFGLALTQWHQAAQPRDLRCTACGHRFTRRSAVAIFARIVFVALVVLAVLQVIGIIAGVLFGVLR
jgi:hypothetical protein